MSAKALGAMVKGMGESCFDDLLPWLMETLASEQSSVDRSGAAQGLAEVMAGLGVEKLDKLMPDVVQTASKVDIASHVRDGYIMMFIYLPLTFGDRFTPYVGPIIPCILKVWSTLHSPSLQSLSLSGCEYLSSVSPLLCFQALADENEYVRDTALRAGQRIISMYAETAIALLLPELEQGLFDDLWRIRSGIYPYIHRLYILCQYVRVLPGSDNVSEPPCCLWFTGLAPCSCWETYCSTFQESQAR